MPSNDHGLVGFQLDEEGKADPAIAGKDIILRATVCYPGSGVTDIMIGDHVFQVKNGSLVKATSAADAALCECLG